MLRPIIFCFLLLPINSQASFLFSYGLNYSSKEDSSEVGDFEESRTFHKLFLGASVNSRKTLFFGWNINSWSSNLRQGTGANEDTYSLTEMGPKLQWFWNENYNLYFTVEWNPYVRGEREKLGTTRDVSGSSTNFGVGYRFRLSRLVGFGAGIHYHTTTLKEEKIDSTENDISDKLTNLMPMLELTIITK